MLLIIFSRSFQYIAFTVLLTSLPCMRSTLSNTFSYFKSFSYLKRSPFTRSHTNTYRSPYLLSKMLITGHSTNTLQSSSSSTKSDSLQRLYDMDEHPERKLFLDRLLHFMEDRGTPITQCPTISKNPLDLFRLYLFTKDRGGFMEVSKQIIVRSLDAPIHRATICQCCL